MTKYSRSLLVIVIAALVPLLALRGDDLQPDHLKDLAKKASEIKLASEKGKYVEVFGKAIEFEKECNENLPANSAALATYLELTGDVYRHTFRYDKLGPILNQILAIRQQVFTAKPDSESRILLAFAYYQLGHNASMLEDLAMSSQQYDIAFQKIPDVVDNKEQSHVRDVLRAHVLGGQAENFIRGRDFNTAVAKLKQSLPIIESLNPPEPWALAYANFKLGEALLKRISANRQHDGGSPRTKEIAEAADFLKQAGAYYATKPDRAPREDITFLEIQLTINQCLIESDRFLQAKKNLETYLEKTKSRLGEKNILRARMLTDLARVNAALGNRAEAEKQFSQAIIILQDVHEIVPTKIDVARTKAELARLKGTAPNAPIEADVIEFVREAFHDHLSLLEDGFDYQTDRERLIAVTDVFFVLNTCITLALDSKIAPVSTPALYKDILAWKGLVFSRSALDREISSAPDRVAEELRRLKHEYLSLAAVCREYSKPAPEVGIPQLWASEAERLRELRDRKEKELTVHRRAAKSQPDQTRIKPETVANSLPDDVVLVDFTVYEHVSSPSAMKPSQKRVGAFLSRKNQPVVYVALGTLKPIQEQLDAWYRALDKEDDASAKELQDHAAALAHILWQPIAMHTYLKDAVRLVISPDDILWSVPFAALPDSTGTKYLIEEIGLSYVLSGRQAYEMFTGQGYYAASPGKGALIIGDIQHGDFKPKNSAAYLENLHIGKPWMDQTVQAYKKYFPHSRILPVQREEATAAKILPELSAGYREIHLLGHGPLISTENSDWMLALSRIRIPLARSNFDSPETGWRNSPDTSEFSMINMPGVRVFLWWGCGVNKGPLVSGEGVIGVPRGLHLAGCQAVLASTWKAKPHLAKLISARFNTRMWCNKDGPAKALWVTQREYLASANENIRHPRYWAPWIVIGDAIMTDQPDCNPSAVEAEVNVQDTNWWRSLPLWFLCLSTLLIPIGVLVCLRLIRFRSK